MTESEVTKTCQYCRAAIPRSAQKCKACGEWVVRRSGCGTLLALVLVLAVAALVVSEDARNLGKSVLDQVSQKAQEWAAGSAEKKPADNWVPLPCELRFTSELSAYNHGHLYEFRDASVRYNRESLELELSFRYRTEVAALSRVRVELIDKNEVTLARSPTIRIAPSDNLAEAFGVKRVYTSGPNTLSWTFARMYYPDTVMVHVVVAGVGG